MPVVWKLRCAFLFSIGFMVFTSTEMNWPSPFHVEFSHKFRPTPTILQFCSITARTGSIANYITCFWPNSCEEKCHLVARSLSHLYLGYEKTKINYSRGVSEVVVREARGKRSVPEVPNLERASRGQEQPDYTYMMPWNWISEKCIEDQTIKYASRKLNRAQSNTPNIFEYRPIIEARSPGMRHSVEKD